MTGMQAHYNVLFLCTGNSARSIMAEAILNGKGRPVFTGHSAGSYPLGAVRPEALKLIELAHLPTEGLRSKSWEEFAKAEAPKMDFVFTVCGKAIARYLINAIGGEDEQANSDDRCDRNAADWAESRTSAAGSAGKLESAGRRGSDSRGACNRNANLCLPGRSRPKICLGIQSARSGADGRNGEEDCASLRGANLEARRWKRSEGKSGRETGRAKGRSAKAGG